MDRDNHDLLDKLEDCINRLTDINPISVKISMFYYIQLLKNNGFNVHKDNKDTVIIAVFLLVCKYIMGYDIYFPVEINSLYCGMTLEKYVKYEKNLLEQLGWKLFIPEKEYNRLYDLFNNRGSEPLDFFNSIL